MIILQKPYVSDFLIQTIKENNFSILENEISKKYFKQEKLTNSNDAIKKYIEDNEFFYTNSENSIDWILENLNNEPISRMIKLSKDKYLFRDALKSIYPDYYFKKIKYENLKTFDVNKIKFPIILKPTTGFLSFGVYPIKNKDEWQKTISKIDDDIKKLKGIFPNTVVDLSDFIIEEMIEGREFALDAYFNENNEAVILNIFEHPFFNEKDVSDRVYYTSKAIIEEFLEPFNELLNKIGKIGNYKNFPFHLELRVNQDEIIPIELNPMRFCGWCITDIAYWAWKINVYEMFFKKLKPDWKSILNNSNNDYFYFTIGDIPSNIERNKIKEIDYSSYLKNIQNPLDIRKIDYKNNPVFAIVFARTNTLDEIKKILNLKMENFII